MKSVLLVGCGNFGSWWASSLLVNSRNIHLVICDTNPNFFDLVLSRSKLLGVISSSNLYSIHHSLDSITVKSFDLALVVTNSFNRFSVCRQLRHRFSATFWILDKVLSPSVAELHLMKALFAGQSVFVNHNRRCQPLWHALLDALPSNKPIVKIRHHLGAWEMAGNSFHFLDIASLVFLSAPLHIPSYALNSWQTSAVRNNSFTCSGHFEVVFANRNVFQLSTVDSNISLFQFCDSSDRVLLELEEVAGSVRKSSDPSYIFQSPLLNWSVICHEVVNSLLASGSTSLPTLGVSIDVHLVLLNMYQEHWNACGPQGLGDIPLIS